jgi:hypothetical protein
MFILLGKEFSMSAGASYSCSSIPVDDALKDVNIMKLDDAIEKKYEAIERKLKADQEAQEMEFKILKERKEAERKEIEAHGIQKFQEVVVKGIDESAVLNRVQQHEEIVGRVDRTFSDINRAIYRRQSDRATGRQQG